MFLSLILIAFGRSVQVECGVKDRGLEDKKIIWLMVLCSPKASLEVVGMEHMTKTWCGFRFGISIQFFLLFFALGVTVVLSV